MQGVIIRGDRFYTPLPELSNIPKLLNCSKLVEGWLLCNEGKKPKLHIQHRIITVNLDNFLTGA